MSKGKGQDQDEESEMTDLGELQETVVGVRESVELPADIVPLAAVGMLIVRALRGIECSLDELTDVVETGQSGGSLARGERLEGQFTAQAEAAVEEGQRLLVIAERARRLLDASNAGRQAIARVLGPAIARPEVAEVSGYGLDEIRAAWAREASVFAERAQAADALAQALGLLDPAPRNDDQEDASEDIDEARAALLDIDEEIVIGRLDPVSVLYEICTKREIRRPRFVFHQAGTQLEPLFIATVAILGTRGGGEGRARNKVEAKKIAARRCLIDFFGAVE